MDSELATALKRGMDVSVSLLSEEGDTLRFDSHLQSLQLRAAVVLGGKAWCSLVPCRRRDRQDLHRDGTAMRSFVSTLSQSQ
ncbi:MAG: hypothetical protein OXB91_08430 [Bryobacterales bacterium]|nr:hypothetical protein [Bryobacterales bacterium]